jgi:enediyne polyketide synthase
MPGCGVTAAITRSDGENGRGEATIRHLLLDEISVLRRADGKPDLPFVEISASHAEDVTMAISGPSPVGCDLEFLRSRSPVLWKDLLGPNFFSLAVRLAKEAGEDQDAAASRVWTALESLKKAGASRDIPLILTCIDKGGWVRLSGGPWNVTTLVAGVQGCENRLAIATAMRSSVLPITLGARRKETAPAAKG